MNKNLWNGLALFLKNDFILFDVSPQAAFLSFLDVDSKVFLVQNYLLLIFEIFICNSRRSESLILKVKSMKKFQ